MKIAICSTGSDLNSSTDPRFGRCPYFVLVDEKGNHLQTLENESQNSPHGAGISTAQFMINNGVSTVLAGKIGPKAIQPLLSAGIDIYTGISGSVNQALQSYNENKLSRTNNANASPHSGSGGGGGRKRR
ncbi:MAG: NifB/NifX family molybdenum-iron cluster-binding protein [Clostridiales bacterium]|nr:NifB/NifX family molybdenum-iron cluster-binding protein [Clostridiales bacterium]MCF8022089.1 NifB/NifX family molybdenum-iron cluster-binding protein [Clostridiales bacterium]